MKEVTVFSYGDSNSLKTWSNVPYFFTTTLEHQGLKVNRVNVEPKRFIRGIWNHIIIRFIRLFYPDSTYLLERTPIFRWYAHIKMKRAVRKFKQTDLFISISFSFHTKKYTDKPTIMFCDWTYDYYFEYFKKRNPDKLELQEIRNQHRLQDNVDAMFVLFPDACNYAKLHSSNPNIFYLGNVINSKPLTIDVQYIDKKFNSNQILFIGVKKYLPGLQKLVQAFIKLRTLQPEFSLNVVGITKSQFIRYAGRVDLTNINFLGYLDKTDINQNKKYYQLVSQAKIFVNTTPNWSSFSATLDVMYHYTPIIVSKYRSFVETFGEDLNFGSYCSNTTDEIFNHINEIISLDYNTYKDLCQYSNQSVQPFTWESYINKLLRTTKNIVPELEE